MRIASRTLLDTIFCSGDYVCSIPFSNNYWYWLCAFITLYFRAIPHHWANSHRYFDNLGARIQWWALMLENNLFPRNRPHFHISGSCGPWICHCYNLKIGLLLADGPNLIMPPHTGLHMELITFHTSSATGGRGSHVKTVIFPRASGLAPLNILLSVRLYPRSAAIWSFTQYC